MKQKFLFIMALLLTMSLGTKADVVFSWDFSALKSVDLTNLAADETGNWYHSTEDKKNRWSYTAALNNEIIPVNGEDLVTAKGLLFTISSVESGEGNVRFGNDDSNKRMWLAGKSTIVIPDLTAGMKVTVSCMSSSKDQARGINTVNITEVSGDFNKTAVGTATSTNVGTVTADGDVMLTMNGAMYIYSIKVEEAESGEGGEGGDEPETPENDYSTTSNTMKNQAVLTLKDGTKRYYNTEDITDIAFNDNNVEVHQAKGNYTFVNKVTDVSFTKADAGQSGDIDNPEGAVVITEAKGWLESAYVKFEPFEGAKTYNVYVKGGQFADYTKIDEQLVRNYGTYGRADVVGLKASTYSIKVIPVKEDKTELTANASEATNIVVKNYVREGFAFFGRGAGVGAYNNDGTLKANAVVLYITNNNFNTISCVVNTGSKSPETFTGLGNILKAMEKGKETRPFCIRFIGEIKVGSVDAAQLMGDKSCLNLKGKTFGDEQNVTYEGIGDDATMNGIGFRFNRAGSVEVRNLAIMNHADDCFEFTQCVRIWVHNMDLFYGNAGGDSDQAKGDGTIDLKKGTRYCTFDNNHFWDCGKASLCGLSGETTADYATYHHNWFDHADSRMPRVRVKTIHIYNNYYDGISKYGAGSTLGSSLLVERNYFRNCKFPMMISLQGNDVYAGSSKYDPANYGTFSKEAGGMIKAYNNHIEGETTSYWPYGATNILTKGAMVTAESLGVETKQHFDCYEVDDLATQVPDDVRSFNGGNTYNNFDTDKEKMYAYNADAPDDVPAAVGSYYGSGRMNHGDFSWEFNNATDDTDYNVNANLKTALNAYATKLVGIFGDENAASGESGVDDGTGGQTGDNGDTTDDGSDPTDDGDGETVPGTVIDGTIECTFEGKKPSSSAFSISGNYADKGPVTYNGKSYTACLKIESKTSVSFTTDKKMKLTLVFDKSGKIKINKTDYANDGTSYVLETTLEKGSYELTKNTSFNLFYIKLEPVE